MHPTIGIADCEARNEGFLEQDVNAWTSLGYVAAGFVLATCVLRGRLPRAFAALAAMTALEGVGSFLYHGRSSDLAQLLHDVPLVGALGFIAGWHAGRIVGGAERVALAGLGLATVAGGVLWAVTPGATNVAVGLLVAVIIGTSLVGRGRGLPGVWNAPMILLVAVAVGGWLAGTPDSPICAEQSVAQPHGLWHVLTAVLVLAWADRAAAAARPDDAPRIFRRGADRLLGAVAGGLAYAFHRSIDVAGREHLPTDRPVLIVANHGNGFVDPIVVAAVLRRAPRFLAKAALWKVAAARPFLALAGVLPVYRSADGDRSSGNRSVFAACHDELARGATVAIFPEGTTGDRAGLDRVRAGAARIALGAVSRAPDLVVVPIGMAFESHVETRTRAVVMIGQPLEVAPFAAAPVVDGEPARDDVYALTEAIRAALEAVSPEYETVDEREVLRAAARTAHHAASPKLEARFGEVEVLARRLAGAPSVQRASVADAFSRYATRLELAGINDRQFRPGSSFARLALSIVALVALGSVVVTATLIHLPALLLIVLATGAVRSTATKGTVRLLVGLVAGLATWVIAGAVLADGWAAVWAGVGVAIEGWIALAVWPPLARAAAALWGRLIIRDRAGLVSPLLADRTAVAASVEAATASAAVMTSPTTATPERAP